MFEVQDLIAGNRRGEAVGLPCFCTANPHVLRTILDHAARTGFPTVIEATCNQVNQEGGYTGMTAADFMTWVRGMARAAGVSPDRLILGGDHLGPNPWRTLPVNRAMAKARTLVRSYVEAGFQKIHLDASMPCGGEPVPTFDQIAERAADLCAVAEAHAPDSSKLIYVIGTEVPVPGGETDEPEALSVTSVARFRETIRTHRAAFLSRGLEGAWHRIVSVVVQPGVDFGHTSVYPFVPDLAKPLRDAIGPEAGLTFEAHSTDYQVTDALAALVRHHFFFLKVGPELTFRFREAVWALAQIDAQLHPGRAEPVAAVVERRMMARPEHWQGYYRGTAAQMRLLRVHSYSDRIRYYWQDPEVSAAVEDLVAALSGQALPETVVSQAFPGLEFGSIPTRVGDLLQMHILRCVSRYFAAAGFGP